jgi:membrane protein implicated in regulation of membrane protease activity
MLDSNKCSFTRPAGPRSMALLSLGLALVTASPHAVAMAPSSAPSEPEAATPSSDPDAQQGFLRVNVVGVIDDALLIPEWIAKRNVDLEGLVPPIEGVEQWVEVEITGNTYDYRITVVAMRDGMPVGAISEPKLCECNSGALLTVIDTEIAAAVEQLRTAAEVEPEEVETLPEITPEPPPEPEAPRRRLSPVGIGGAVVTAFGAAALGGGAAMMLLGTTEVRDRTSLVRDWEPLGVTTLAVGGSAFLAGVTMMVVDAVQCRRHAAPRRCERPDEERPGRRLEVAPTIGNGRGGVTLFGRF